MFPKGALYDIFDSSTVHLEEMSTFRAHILLFSGIQFECLMITTGHLLVVLFLILVCHLVTGFYFGSLLLRFT